VDQIYNKLFGEEEPSAKRKQIENDQNVSACLKRNMRQMENQQASEGSATSKIETYRNVIAGLDKQIAHESCWLDTANPNVPDTLSPDPEFAFSSKVANLRKLSRFALQTDSTGVITLSLDWVCGAINVPAAARGCHKDGFPRGAFVTGANRGQRRRTKAGVGNLCTAPRGKNW